MSPAAPAETAAPARPPMPAAVPSPSDPNSGPLDYLSASRLKCWQECRLKFYYSYVARLPSFPSQALFVGKAIHHVLQQWNLARWRGLPADAESLRPVFEAYWDHPPEGEGGGRDEAEAGAEPREGAWKMLEHYLSHTPVPLGEKPEAVEVLVERDLAPEGLPPLRGVIDLVRAGGRIVDFKTSARAPDATLAPLLHETQLSTYALLYREATGRQESGFELHFLLKTKQPRLIVSSLGPAGRGRLRRLLQLMESYVAGIGAEDYVPSPGLQCSYCDFRRRCLADA